MMSDDRFDYKKYEQNKEYKDINHRFTMEDILVLKHIIHDILSGWYARNDSQYEIFIDKLDKINERLDSLNGKVASHEEWLNEFNVETEVNKATTKAFRDTRAKTCPHLDEILVIKTDQITEKKAKNMFFKGIALFSSILGAILIIIELIKFFLI